MSHRFNGYKPRFGNRNWNFDNRSNNYYGSGYEDYKNEVKKRLFLKPKTVFLLLPQKFFCLKTFFYPRIQIFRIEAKKDDVKKMTTIMKIKQKDRRSKLSPKNNHKRNNQSKMENRKSLTFLWAIGRGF